MRGGGGGARSDGKRSESRGQGERVQGSGFREGTEGGGKNSEKWGVFEKSHISLRPNMMRLNITKLVNYDEVSFQS